MTLPQTVLVFDTETTGLPLWKQPLEHPSQPHIVQLAFVVYHQRRPVHTQAMLISSIFESSPEAEAVHKKSMALRQTFGVSYAQALTDLAYYANQVDLVVAHNLAFDLRMVARATRFIGCAEVLPRRQLCTMLLTTDLMRIPGPKGWKWPRLEEAYTHFCPEVPWQESIAHDALYDVHRCADLLFTLDRQGYITYDTDWDRYLPNEEPTRRPGMALDGTLGVREDLRRLDPLGGGTEGESPLDRAQGDGNSSGRGREAAAPARELGVALRSARCSGLESTRHDDETNQGDGV